MKCSTSKVACSSTSLTYSLSIYGSWTLRLSPPPPPTTCKIPVVIEVTTVRGKDQIPLTDITIAQIHIFVVWVSFQ